MNPVEVVEYDPRWPETFERLRVHIWPAVEKVALSVEHIGSTAVPGLAAKPIIDLSVVVGSAQDMASAIAGLKGLGYIHEGDGGIPGREAFRYPDGMVEHHLYACLPDSIGLVNPVVFRDFLLTHPETAQAYGELKLRLAGEFPKDRVAYTNAKTAFILEILERAGLSTDRLEKVVEANLRNRGPLGAR